jgi:hypothetical protein
LGKEGTVKKERGQAENIKKYHPLFSSNKVRLETSFSKWFRKTIFLVCIAYVNFIPKRQSNRHFRLTPFLDRLKFFTI